MSDQSTSVEIEGHVRMTREGALAIATLHNPAKRNAITLDMWQALSDFAMDVSGDPDIRVVLIRGSHDVFSGGADITGFAAARHSTDAARVYDDRLEAACRTVEAIRQPTVAMLAGPVAGAGLALAASCDLRVAADTAFMMVPAARLGLGYDPRAIARLLRTFGPATARQIMLTGGRIPAARAYAVGAVTELVPAGELEAATRAQVDQLLSNAPITMAAAKVSLRAFADGAEPTLLDEAWRLTDAADASADYTEGRDAFAQKRKPEFRGC